MVLNRIGLPLKRKIVGIALGALALAQLPYIGPTVEGILNTEIIEPVTVGVVVGVVGVIGAYMLLANEGI